MTRGSKSSASTAMLVGVFAASLVASCASSGKVDLVTAGAVLAEREESELIELSVPHVQREGDALVVSGDVSRKPGVDGPIPGHVRILFFSPEGTELDELSPVWDPAEIPIAGSRRSSYLVRYGWLPPRETIVRAVYGEHEHEVAMSAEGGSKPAGPGAGSSYTRTASRKGTPQRRGTPGTPRGGGRR